MDASDPKFGDFCHDLGIHPLEFQRGVAGTTLTHDATVAAGTGFFQDPGDDIHICVL